MRVQIYQVDAFAEKPFTGNPAAVCILNSPADEAWMQSVAREMNLSETAFLCKAGDGYNLRWFTPAVEVELCGHATLASAHVLYTEGMQSGDEVIEFHTKSGLLKAGKKDDFIELNFPSRPSATAEPPLSLNQALDVEPIYAARAGNDFLIEVYSEDILRNLKPDFMLLRELPLRGVIVTSSSRQSQYDFCSRFFAPGAGIDEDPVTGSAHCVLAPFWGKRLGRDEMVGYQASSRGGMIRVKLAGQRVKLAGKAVTVLRGELNTA